MNTFNPAKLQLSKWTAVKPLNKELHFVVSDITYDEHGTVIDCALEAVINRNVRLIDWRELKDESRWYMGWK